MKQKTKGKTRREFLELSVGAAGALLTSGLGCSGDEGADEGDGANQPGGTGAAGGVGPGVPISGGSGGIGATGGVAGPGVPIAGGSGAAGGGGQGVPVSGGAGAAGGVGGQGVPGSGGAETAGTGGPAQAGSSGQGVAGGGGQDVAGGAGGGTAGVGGPDAGAPDTAPPPAGRRGYRVFSPGQIGAMVLKNRLYRSATWESMATNGEVSDRYVDLHRALALGGVGMSITGFTAPMEEDAMPNQIHVFDDRHISGLRRVSDAVHQVDSDFKIVAQIGHSARGSTVSFLSAAQVGAIVTAFAQAVRRVQEAGWDGAQLHGAHGYLLSTFLSPAANNRTDQYGGSTENRVRIIAEIVEQSRQLVGQDFPIIIKANSDDNVPGGIDTNSFPEVARAIEAAGVDAIEVSGNDYSQTGIDRIEEEAYFLEGAETIDVSVPVMLVGGNRTIDHLEEIIQQGEVSFFGLSRPLLREPDLPNRWLDDIGDATADCISCNQCFMAMMQGVRCLQV